MIGGPRETGRATGRAIGIDVGGTKCLGIVWHDDNVVAEVRMPTPAGQTAIVDTLSSIVGHLEAEVGACDTVGVGVPGLVTRHGVINASPNLIDIRDFAVGGQLSSRLDRRVWVDNDATCAAVAEWIAGSAEGCTDACIVTLGTGIGGGIVAGGSLLRGTNGFAGEIGHMVVDADGIECPCGRRGCWERYASGSGLARLAREAASANRLRRVVEEVGGIDSIRGEHVRGAAEAGDEESLAVIDEFGRWVALGLVNIANILDPERFVIGGGLAASGDIFLTAIGRWFARLLYSPEQRPHPDLVVARFAETAGAVGAALLPQGH